MQIDQFRHCLETNSDAMLRVILPSGESIPDHFHITEVGRLDKAFIDCGGTQRKTSSCMLQAWVANDTEHRLTAGKLAKILELAEPVLGAQDLRLELEYGEDVAAQYIVSDVEINNGHIEVRLAGRQTECLAPDKCGIEICSDPGCCC